MNHVYKVLFNAEVHYPSFFFFYGSFILKYKEASRCLDRKDKNVNCEMISCEIITQKQKSNVIQVEAFIFIH